MATRLTVYNRQGQYLAELDAIAKRTWLLSKVGSASFSISTSDPKCRPDYLQYGNLVLIEHDHLPDWGGVICTPRTWGNFQIEINCKSADWLFSWRRGKDGQKFKGSAGNNYKSLIDFANTPEDLYLRVGELYTGGQSIPVQLSYADQLTTTIDALVKDSGGEYKVEPKFDNNRQLYFAAGWYEKVGVKRQTRLEEGLNIEFVSDMLTEQGEIINDFRAMKDKSNFTVTDDVSQGSYGLRQKTETITLNAGKDDSLQQAAFNRMKRTRYPTKTFNFVVLNEGTIWDDIDIGNEHPAKLLTTGFSANGFGMDTTVRVTGMTYDGMSTVEVVSEEVV